MRALLLALSLLRIINADVTIELDEEPNKFETVVYESIESLSDSVFIKSNIPVTVLQYQHEFHRFDRLLFANQMLIFVKAACRDNESQSRFSPNFFVDVFDTPCKEQVLYMNGFVPENNRNNITQVSSFRVQWDTYDQMCLVEESREEKSKRGIGLQIAHEVTDSHLEETFEGSQSGSDNVNKHIRGKSDKIEDTTPREDSGCTLSAEVLYDPCYLALEVSAPFTQVYREKSIENITAEPSETEKCNIVKSGRLTFNDDPIRFNDTHKLLKLECPVMAMGRPFIDEKGFNIQAEAHLVDNSVWSPTEEEERNEVCSTNCSYISRKGTEKEKSQEIDFQGQGEDWTARALGEHSSIASFAAFTIQLMTNNAPPDLIEDALKAALDELRHAQTSFDMASLLSQQEVSPGSLPPTSHHFEQDLTVLALRVAKEGCVDETLSALVLAAEVQQLNEGNIALSFSWKEKVTTITKEEAKHAALAWRVIHWVCGEDQIACQKVVQFFALEANSLVLTRIQSLDLDSNIIELVQQHWSRISNKLLPLVTNGHPSQKFNNADETTFIAEIGDNIINHFVSAVKNKKSFVGVSSISESELLKESM